MAEKSAPADGARANRIREMRVAAVSAREPDVERPKARDA